MTEDPLFVQEPAKPHTAPPAGSWDTFAHVYGSYEQYPLSDEPKMFLPPEEADFAAVRRMHSAIGVDYGVLVQGTSYGTDHSAILAALAASDKYVGVGIVDDTLSDAQVHRLHDAGIRGARFHDLPWLDMHLSVDELERQSRRVAPLGWHLVLHIMGDYLVEHEAELARLEIPVVIDHLAHLNLTEGLDQPAVKTIQRLLATGNWWIRLSNGDRVSREPSGFRDVAPLISLLADTAPERALWGTDWPHSYYKKTRMPDDRELIELLYDAIPDPELRHQILVDNPRALYGKP